METQIFIDHPILFTTENVEALVAGRKTQTRRIIKGNALEYLNTHPEEPYYLGLVADTMCPYGRKNDVLWIRETWKLGGASEDGELSIHFKDGTVQWLDPGGMMKLEREEYWQGQLEKLQLSMEHKNKVTINEKEERITWKINDVPWRPSIHMPKDTCRLWLEVVDVGVERLHEITEEDARAEGCQGKAPIEAFNELWRKINGVANLASDPWVWVVEFKVLEGRP